MKNIENNLIIGKVLFALKDYGVDILEAQYSGGGDDGTIDQIFYWRHTKTDGSEEREVQGVPYKIHADVRDSVCDIIYKHLETVDDWYNNEGGYGEYRLNLNTLEYTINNNVYYRETHSDYGEGTFFE